MKKSITLILALIVVISLLVSTAVFASAESSFEPSGNIEWYITSSPGGGSDIYTRKIIEIISGNGWVTNTFLPTNLTDGGGEVGRMKVATLIETLPGYGKAKSEKIMAELKIAESRRLRGLGARQEAALLERLG